MFTLFLQDAWKVLVYSLILGAGLPVVYAVGVRSLAMGSGGSKAESARRPLGMAVAVICFLIVLAGVAVGLTYIIAAGKGEQLSFSHVYPTFIRES